MTAYDRVREQRTQARRELADVTGRMMLSVTLVQAMRCDCYQPDLHLDVACHDEIHRNPEQAYALGWLVRSGFDPADVPVVIP